MERGGISTPGLEPPSELPPHLLALLPPLGVKEADRKQQKLKQEWDCPSLLALLSTPGPASPLTEGAGVLWGSLDAPVGICLEVETLAAEQFGDDAFKLRL